MFHLAIQVVFYMAFYLRNWLVLSFGMVGRMVGSCTGSQVILELLLNGTSPAAIVCQADEIIALGAIVAEELFDRRLPVVFLEVRDDPVLRASKFDTRRTLFGWKMLPELNAGRCLSSIVHLDNHDYWWQYIMARGRLCSLWCPRRGGAGMKVSHETKLDTWLCLVWLRTLD